MQSDLTLPILSHTVWFSAQSAAWRRWSGHRTIPKQLRSDIDAHAIVLISHTHIGIHSVSPSIHFFADL